MAGCGIMLAMLFGVFILISETWFQQWQTELGAAILGAAQRYMVAIGVVAFFVSLREQEYP
jgi:predicted small integral membrane protein